ncbi:MAG: septum formation initiator family protein [Erysipelotrichaceae bacterium]|nr:septum formation initiator family protein [Erysipelotrichaceae bacterium]
MTKTRRRFKFKSLAIALVLFTISGFMMVPVIQEVMTTIALKKSLDEVNTKLSALSVENETLTLQRDKLLDTDYVISYARGIYMLSKDTEKVYYFKDNTVK